MFERMICRNVRFVLTLLFCGTVATTVDAANVKFTAEVPNGSLNFNSLLSWNVWNSDQFGPGYEVDLNPGQTGNNVVTTMRNEMNSFGNPFNGDGSVSSKTLTVDTASSGDFTTAAEVSMTMETNPDSCYPCSPPGLPFLYEPPEIPHAIGVLILFLNNANGQPTLAGGNGNLVVSVGLDGGSVPIVATVGFSPADSTLNILNVLDSTFSSATLPAGAMYAGVIKGSPVFYTLDQRPMSVGFSSGGTDSLNFVTGAAIYYVPEPESILLLLGAASALFVAPRRR